MKLTAVVHSTYLFSCSHATMLEGTCSQPHVVDLEAYPGSGSYIRHQYHVPEVVDTCPYPHAFGGTHQHGGGAPATSSTSGPSFVLKIKAHTAARQLRVQAQGDTSVVPVFDSMLFVSPTCSSTDIIASKDDWNDDCHLAKLDGTLASKPGFCQHLGSSVRFSLQANQGRIRLAWARVGWCVCFVSCPQPQLCSSERQHLLLHECRFVPS